MDRIRRPSKRTLFSMFLSVRVLMAICANSLHHGDETYQSVEVAHKLVYGTGYLTWEWTTPNPIRSYIHPHEKFEDSLCLNHGTTDGKYASYNF